MRARRGEDGEEIGVDIEEDAYVLRAAPGGDYAADDSDDEEESDDPESEEDYY